MLARLLSGSILLFACSCAALAQPADGIRQFPIDTVERLGLAIFRQDLAAALATDRLRSQDLSPEDYPTVGWISTEDERGFLVTFIGLHNGEFVGVFDIRPQSSGEDAFQIADDRALTEHEMTVWLAQLTAFRGVSQNCSANFDPVVLQDPESDDWLVYLLSPATQSGVIPVGGHYRMTVSADGTELVRAEKLSKSCLRLKIDVEDAPTQATADALTVTQLVGETPLETQVWLSLLYGVEFSVSVSATGRLWHVADGAITIAEQPVL